MRIGFRKVVVRPLAGRLDELPRPRPPPLVKLPDWPAHTESVEAGPEIPIGSGEPPKM